jgi:hypothetical protein
MDNHKLHDAIDIYFPNGNGFSDFDGRHKSYKINHLLAPFH